MANKYADTQAEKNLKAASAGESMTRNNTYFTSKAKQEGKSLLYS